MDPDSALPASDTAAFRGLEQRIQTLERRFNQIPASLPMVPIFGAVQDSGFHTHSLTSMSDMYRVDGYVLSSVLDYDIQVSDAYAGTPPTSIDWQIEVLGFGAFADTVIASDTSTSPPEQFFGFVDLVSTIGEDIMGRFVSFRLAAKHTGGTGEACGLRLVKPLIFRIREV